MQTNCCFQYCWCAKQVILPLQHYKCRLRIFVNFQTSQKYIFIYYLFNFVTLNLSTIEYFNLVLKIYKNIYFLGIPKARIPIKKLLKWDQGGIYILYVYYSYIYIYILNTVFGCINEDNARKLHYDHTVQGSCII